ncbi:AraC family transcriptional regulator [Achromobacter sp. GG226]|nr:AraC family transcriptional regulator [Verticiella sp. GG226]
MIALLQQLAPTEGFTASRLDDVTFMRADQPLPVTPALYEPSLVFVLQGRKRGVHGGQPYVYDAGHYLVLTVPLPFSTQTEASAAAPMLGLTVRISPALTADIAMRLDDLTQAPAHAQPTTLYASPLDDALEDALWRLLQALASPEDAAILGPALLREITYRVLRGPQGGSLRAALQQGSHFGRIAKVLRRVHTHYAQSLDVPTLAEEANLSVPAFHVHFKAVTATSPIQYIKSIRLHQARLMMIRQGTSVARAADAVGYESASQFSREFKRMFGRSPVDETRHLQTLFALAPAVEGQAGTVAPAPT